MIHGRLIFIATFDTFILLVWRCFFEITDSYTMAIHWHGCCCYALAIVCAIREDLR
jgi:hypothetical protein